MSREQCRLRHWPISDEFSNFDVCLTQTEQVSDDVTRKIGPLDFKHFWKLYILSGNCPPWSIVNVYAEYAIKIMETWRNFAPCSLRPHFLLCSDKRVIFHRAVGTDGEEGANRLQIWAEIWANYVPLTLLDLTSNLNAKTRSLNKLFNSFQLRQFSIFLCENFMD